MHVDRKESTKNAKLQLGDPPGWPVTCSDLAPLAVAGSTPSITDGNGSVDLVQDFARRELSEWSFHPVLHRLSHSALDAPAVALRVQHSKSQAPGCFHQPGHLVCIVHPGASNWNGSRAKEVTTPKGCPVLFGGRNGMSTGGIPGQPQLSRHRPDPIVKNCTELIGGGSLGHRVVSGYGDYSEGSRGRHGRRLVWASPRCVCKSSCG